MVVVVCAGRLFSNGGRVRSPWHATRAVRRLGLGVTQPARCVNDWLGDRWEVAVSRSDLARCQALCETPGTRGGTVLARWEGTPEAIEAERARVAAIRAANEAEERAAREWEGEEDSPT